MSDQNGDDKDKKVGKSLAELCVERRKVVRKKNNLSSTARLLFDALTDDAFLQLYSVGFGVVRIGKPALAEELGCSVPTITRSQAELSPGELWTRTGWYEGHEITIWFLRGIADNQMEFDAFTSGVTKAPRTRIAPRVEKARNGHGHFCKKDKTPDLLEKPEATADLTVGPGQVCHLAPVNPAGATTSNLTVVNGQNQPSGHGRNDRGQRSNLTGANGHSHRGGPGRNDVSTRSELTGYKDRDTKDGDTRKPERPAPPVLALETAFNQWRDGLPKPLYDRELEQRKARLDKTLKTASGDDLALTLRKLAWIHERLDLPAPVAPTATASTTAAKIKPKPAPRPPMSEAEELLNVARLRLAVGAFDKLTKPHVLALLSAGDTLPPMVAQKFAALAEAHNPVTA